MLPSEVVAVARAAAIGPADALVAALVRLPDPVTAAARLREHLLSSLVLETAAMWNVRHRLPPDLVAAIETQRPLKLLDPSAALDGFETISQRLASRGIDALMLKGAVFGERLYGSLRRRPQFDLDVLVRPRRWRAIHAALTEAGFARHSYDRHSVTYASPTLKVDVHGWLRRAPIYRVDDDRMWSSAVEWDVAGRKVRTLSDEFQVLLVALSLFQDLGQGMIRLRHVLDAWLLLRALDRDLDWTAFFAARRHDRTDVPVAHTLAVILTIFGADQAPRLQGALASLPIDTRQSSARAQALLFASRKHPDNLRWFGDVYPGSMLRYLVAFWWGGFPANLQDLDRQRLRAAGAALSRRPADSQ